MQSQFRHGVVALALIASAGSAAAQTTVITREPAPRTVVREQLVLTPAQRQTVYRTIVRERPVAAPRATVEYRVGMRVPENVQLYTVPEDVAVEVPAVRPYKYMYVNDRVVLVDPVTSEVVGEVVE